MGIVKTYRERRAEKPSLLALLIDDISRMSRSEQKLLWMQLNQKKLSILAQQMDANVTPHDLTEADIDALIAKTKKNGRNKEKS